MVEHKAGTLLIGVIERHTAIIGCRTVGHTCRTIQTDHIGNLAYDNTLGPAGHFISRCDPLMRGAVRNPGGDAAMQMQSRTVFRKTHHSVHHASVSFATHWVANLVEHGAFIHRFHHLHGTHTRAHKGRVNRNE